MEQPHFIDPRVARGQARLISEATSQFTIKQVFNDAIARATKHWRAGMSGREAYRYMSRVLKPTLDKHLIEFPLARMDSMTIYCGIYEQRGQDGSIDFFFFVCCSSIRPGDGLMYRIGLSQHALQRIIQRTGQAQEKNVRTRLYTAVANIYWIQPWIYNEAWQQLGLVCEEGVFVGTVSGDRYNITTFIPALDNGRPSKWRDFHADVWPSIRHLVSRERQSDVPKSAIGNWYLFADGLSNRHPFLLKQYIPGHDYLTEAWASAPMGSLGE
jgi:hypothetical protein